MSKGKSKTTISANAGVGRETYIGGSDAAAILGVSPWRTPYQLWCEKSGIEVPEDLSQIDYIYFGTLLEPVVAKVFAERVAPVIVHEDPYQHKDYPFLAGHIDRLVDQQPAFLECKTANAFTYSKWSRTEMDHRGIPVQYLAQCDHYMMVGDFEFCYVAVLIGGNEFRHYRIERDAKREKVMLAAELEFWRRVQNDDPPPITTEVDAKHRWAKALEGTSSVVSRDVRKRLVELSQVTAQIKNLEATEKEIRDLVFPLFEDKEYLVESGETIARLTNQEVNFFDQKTFKKKAPKMAARYMSKRNQKRFTNLV